MNSLQIGTYDTARLTCRRPRGRDRRAYSDLFLDPAVAAALFPPPLAPYGRRDAARLLRADIEHWHRHGFGPWALLDRATGDFVGRGGLAWTTIDGRQVVELPWTIVPSRWGEGLASEAGAAALAVARALDLPEVVSFTRTDNAASRRVMEKVGLEYAGEITHAGLPHALFRDSARPAR
jgi:ribosomal-protein-alanine N-acetyltransferase